jgi:hypothetical protein
MRHATAVNFKEATHSGLFKGTAEAYVLADRRILGFMLEIVTY